MPADPVRKPPSRLLCLDVDGTIVDREGDLVPEAARLVVRATRAGWTIALCSARSRIGIMPVVAQLPEVNILSTFGGGLVLRRTNYYLPWRHVGAVHYLSKESVDVVYRLWRANRDRFELWAFTEDGWLVSQLSERTQRESTITTQAPSAWVSETFRLLSQRFIKMVIPDAPLDVFFGIRDVLRKLDVKAVYSTGSQVEILDHQLGDKGLSKMIGERSSVVVAAVGDGANDYGLLASADRAYTFEDGATSLHAIEGVRVLPSNRGDALQALSRELAD